MQEDLFNKPKAPAAPPKPPGFVCPHCGTRMILRSDECTLVVTYHGPVRDTNEPTGQKIQESYRIGCKVRECGRCGHVSLFNRLTDKSKE